MYDHHSECAMCDLSLTHSGTHSDFALQPPPVERRKRPRDTKIRIKPLRKILVVDDSEAERRAIAGALHAVLGHIVYGAVNGTDGIIKAKELKPDVVVMDLAMPLMNGLEASAVLNQEMPKLPIVVLSLYSEEIRGPKSKSFGILTVLSKTDGLGPLLKCLRELFP